MESESESDSQIISGRLGKCEVCNFNEAKYTCPKCEVKTCRLECLKIHKKELNCDGIRDKTKYIPLKQITESDLMSDYIFLEDCTLYASARRTDKVKSITAHGRSLATPLTKLKKATLDNERQITLKVLLPNFEKRKSNTTFYDWKSKIIFWRIEWRFIVSDDEKTVIAFDDRCNETESMTTLISKYFENKNSNELLEPFHKHGLDKVTLLLKAEGIRKCQKRFYAIDRTKTLKECLFKRTIVEFPVIFVVFTENLHKYDVINDDEELIVEETKMHKNIYFPPNKRKSSAKNTENELTKKPKEPINFLFSNEHEIDDDDDDDASAEE